MTLAVFFCAIAPQVHAKVLFRRSAAVTAQSVYAVDFTNRRVIFSRDPHTPMYPASTVKLLTALVVLEKLSLKDRVTVSLQAVRVEPTKAGLTRGANYAVEDLLTVLLATSANDAAVALAEATAGSQEKFAVLMNRKARVLGADESNFTNPTGLPDKQQVTTAYDYCIITREAFSNPFIRQVMMKKIVTITGSDGRTIRRPNHNKFLWRSQQPLILGKTGYTRQAGHCYAGVVYYDDRRISVVMLKSRKPWKDLSRILGISFKKV